MRAVTEENLEIAQSLCFPFENEEFGLDKWGNVDFHCLKDDIRILLEVEKGQKHPNTNVLKIWPYLEENTVEKIILIHVIRPENRAPKNRLNLCDFTGKKLESIFPDRFAYILHFWDKTALTDLNQAVKKKLEALT